MRKIFAIYGFLALSLPCALDAEEDDGVEIVASARSGAFAIKDVSIKYVTRDSFPILIEYSPTLWYKGDAQEGASVRIVVSGDTVATETVYEGTDEGTYEWTPPHEGNYLIELITSGGLVRRKKYTFNPPPTVAITREGQALCKLTPSDEEAPIRYTLDGTQPTSESPLYTGPFPVSLNEFSFVKASTFADGMPQGPVESAHFNPLSSVLAGASAVCMADNQDGVRVVGYNPMPIAYDTTWGDRDGASAELLVDGEVVADRLVGSGDVAWTPGHDGINELSLCILEEDGVTVITNWTAKFDAVPRMVALDDDGGDFLADYAGLGLWVTNMTISSQAALDGVTSGGALGMKFPNLEYLLLGTGVTQINAKTLSGFNDLGRLVIPRTLVGALSNGLGNVARDHDVIGVYDGGKGTFSENDDGYQIEAKPGKTLDKNDFTFKALLDGKIVDTSEGYVLDIANDGESASVTLLPPKFGASQTGTLADADPSDPARVLMKGGEVPLAASPSPSEGETVAAIPVETVPGLFYQASWGDDLRAMETGEKVQATGGKLYLGVVKQTGEAGFYKVSASEN